MPFRLHNEAEKWFKDLADNFKRDRAPKFEMYYLCAIAGLATNTLSEAKDAETNELVDNFPGEFASKGRLIMALFISRELRRQGVVFTERTAMNSSIAKLVDPDSPSRLSSEGIKILNQYSNGGLEVMAGWFEERPRKIESFLPLFHRHILNALAGKDE